MGQRRKYIAYTAWLLLAGCASNPITKNPVGISGGINGLQQSVCNCGGLEARKSFKSRRNAEAKAQGKARKASESGKH